MAADKEAVGLSRVHIYEYKCILSFIRDNWLFCINTTCTQSADNMQHVMTSDFYRQCLQNDNPEEETSTEEGPCTRHSGVHQGQTPGPR